MYDDHNMRATWVLFFLSVSLVANALFIAKLVRERNAQRTQQIGANAEFAITLNSNTWTVSYPRRGWFWTVAPDMISMNCGLHQSATLFVDDKTNQVWKVLLELAPTNGVAACYVTDLNGDGIPDQRQFKSNWKNEIFFRGEFLPGFESTNGRSVVVGRSDERCEIRRRAMDPHTAYSIGFLRTWSEEPPLTKLNRVTVARNDTRKG